jgi:hypothetical protein
MSTTPSKFNNYIKSTGAKILVDRFIDKKSLDKLNTATKLKTVTFTVDEENRPASYYVENNLTAAFTVNIDYTTDASSTKKHTSFEIPKEIDGVFIIEGAYRIQTANLGSDYDCRINISDKIGHYINFDYSRQYDIDKHILKIKPGVIDQVSGQEITRQREIRFDNIDDILNSEDKEDLRLTERQSKKLMIKLDLDYKPEYITKQLINECIAFGDDKVKDLIIDKKISSISKSFIDFMFSKKYYKFARGIIHNPFIKTGAFSEQLTPITTQALKFFKGSNKKSKSDEQNVQVPPGINAMNLEAIHAKITIPETVAYNSTMSDLIDFSDTPNNNNVNKQNSLTVSTHIEDDEVLFDVYDKKFKKITIAYLDYLNSKVCASEYVDYEKNTLKPDQNGEVEVKYRMKRKMVKVEDIDLIDLHPDYRLSATTRQIPFLNLTDSVRICMGSSMLKQAIPITHAEKALVSPGVREELKTNIENEFYDDDEPGKVTAVTDTSVIVKSKSGKEYEFLRKTALKSTYDICVYTEPKVKVGQTVKKGDVITGDIENTGESYKSGVNTLVLFHAYHGLVNEDAVVVSQSYSEKLSHYSIIDFEVDIKNMAALTWIAPIGTKVKSGDELVIYNKIAKIDNNIRAFLERGLYGTDKQFDNIFSERSLTVSNNIDEAYVSDVYIQEVSNPAPKGAIIDKTFGYTSKPVIEAYMKDKEEQRKKIIFKDFPEYVAVDKLRKIDTSEKDYRVLYNVRVRIIKKSGLVKGSKIVNRYGGKGVISKIVPDEMMPIMVDKASGKQYNVEVIMNPYSTINRKIAGVLMEQNLGLVAHKVQELVEKYQKTDAGKKKIMPLVTKFYPRYDDMKLEDFLKLHNSKPIEEVYYFYTGSFTNFTQKQVQDWLDDLGIEAQSEILFPSEDVTDLDELKEELSEEEYEAAVKSLKGKYTKCQKKLQCGWLTMMLLYQIPAYSAKVTSSMFGPDLDPKKSDPIMGQGLYRNEGQKIGEMELSALLSRNATNFIKSSRSTTELEDNQKFLNNLLALGMTIKDEDGYNQGGSNLKKNIQSLKNKFRLKQ